MPRPYDAVGRLGVSGQQVRERLAQMLETGLIRRIGAVPNHYRLGFTANGMTWGRGRRAVDQLGERIGQLPGVSHCYRRPRRPRSGPTTCSPWCTAATAPRSSARPRRSALLAKPAAPTTSFTAPPSSRRPACGSGNRDQES